MISQLDYHKHKQHKKEDTHTHTHKHTHTHTHMYVHVLTLLDEVVIFGLGPNHTNSCHKKQSFKPHPLTSSDHALANLQCDSITSITQYPRSIVNRFSE